MHSVANTVGTEDDCRQDKTTQNPNRGQISGEGANVRRRRAGLCGPGGDVAGRSPDRGGGSGAGSWSRVGGRRQTAERRRQTQPGTVSSLAHRPSVPLPRRFHRLHRIFAILTTSASPSPSPSVQPRLQRSPIRNTQTTERATSAVTGRSCVMHAMRPLYNYTKLSLELTPTAVETCQPTEKLASCCHLFDPNPRP